MSQIIDKIVTSKYPPATNVAWMDTSSGDPMLKVFRNGTWETVTAEEPDLSNYIQKSSTAGLVKNDGTIDSTDLGDKQDVSFINSMYVEDLPDNTLVCTGNTIYRIRNSVQTLSISLPFISIASKGDMSIKIYITTTSEEPNITFSSESPVAHDNVTFEASSVYEIICTANGFFWTVKSNKIVIDQDARLDSTGQFIVSGKNIKQGKPLTLTIKTPDGTTPPMVATVEGTVPTQTFLGTVRNMSKITISDLPRGRHRISVGFAGNEFYQPSSGEVVIEVSYLLQYYL